MRGSVTLVGVVMVVLVLVVAAFVTGTGPAPGGNSGDDIEHFPTATPGSAAGPGGSSDDGSGGSETGGTGDGDGSAGDGDSTAVGPDTPFVFSVDGMESCGDTCRDVTTSLTNRQSTDASNVQVYTRMFAGNGTDGKVVWQGTREVGALDASESVSATTRVELSYTDGLAVKQNDGWITVQTTVQSDEETMTVTSRRQVA